MANVQEVGVAQFDAEVLQSPLPVLVDFWAPWCMPCRIVGPVVERIAERFAGKLKVVKVNVSENEELATRWGIHSIPSLFVFKNGEVVAQLIGAQPEAVIAQAVEGAL
jgi:thioredoxin 1